MFFCLLNTSVRPASPHVGIRRRGWWYSFLMVYCNTHSSRKNVTPKSTQPGSVFPSVYGKVNDILLLSQSFDDTANYEHFLPPEGTMLLDWIKGDDEVRFCSVTMYFASNLRGSGPTYWTCNTSRKAAFAYGTRLIRDGDTGELTTIGPGGVMTLLELATIPDSSFQELQGRYDICGSE